MRAWINDKLELLAFLRYMFPAILKNVMGRWFYFRDTPTWVVTRIATLDYEGEDPDIARFVLEAQRELESRIFNIERELTKE